MQIILISSSSQEEPYHGVCVVAHVGGSSSFNDCLDRVSLSHNPSVPVANFFQPVIRNGNLRQSQVGSQVGSVESR